MRIAMALLMSAAMTGSAVAGPIYSTIRIHKSPEVLDQENREREQEYREWYRICDMLPQLRTCQGPTTEEKILRELEMMRKER